MAGPTDRKDFAEDVSRKLNLTAQPPSEKPKEEKEAPDPVDQIEAAVYRGERLKAFKQAAGIKEEAPPAAVGKSDEKVTIDIGTIFKSQSELVQSALNKLSEGGKGSGSDLYLEHLKEDLNDLKKQVSEGTADPMEVLLSTDMKLNTFVEQMKKRMGLPQSMATQPSDLPNMIELEKIKTAESGRHDRWTEDLAEKKRRWEIDDRHWLEDFELRKQAAADTQLLAQKDEQRKDKATSKLLNLAEGIMESIETEEGYEAPARKQKAEPPPRERIIRPKKVKCTCGKMLDVPPDAAEVECKTDEGGCGSVWEIVEATKDESEVSQV